MQEFEKLMYYLLAKYKLLNDKDDYIDLCYIGYTKAINTYDRDKNASLNSYIYSCMANELKQEIRRKNSQKRKKEEYSLDYIMEENTNMYELISSKYCLEEELINKESKNNIIKAISILDEREQNIIKDMYLDQLNRREIGKKYKIEIRKINEILENAYNKMRDAKTYRYLQ